MFLIVSLILYMLTLLCAIKSSSYSSTIWSFISNIEALLTAVEI